MSPIWAPHLIMQRRLSQIAARRANEVIDEGVPSKSEEEQELEAKKEDWDLFGQSSKNFDFKVKYTAPPSAAFKEKDIMPSK